jgi:hypothetical protein
MLLAGVAVSVALARSSTTLYYETETPLGTLAIQKLTLTPPRTSSQVVGVGLENVFGIALGGRYVFWITEAGANDRGALMRATLNGRHVRRLVGRVDAPTSVIVVGRYVYWSAERAIGRVSLNGSHLRRRFIVLPQEKGGGVADGLTSDGTYLYFSRCEDDTIGRVPLTGQGAEPDFISLRHKSCPQGLAVAGNHLYWTELGSGRVGRADLDGTHVNGRWLNVHSDQGPFQVVADSAHVYWTWGGVNGSPSYTGRANSNRSHLDRKFLLDSVYPMALVAPPVAPSPARRRG